MAGRSRCGEADGGGRGGELVRLPDDRLVVDLHIEGWDEDDYSVIARVLGPPLQPAGQEWWRGQGCMGHSTVHACQQVGAGSLMLSHAVEEEMKFL